MGSGSGFSPQGLPAQEPRACFSCPSWALPLLSQTLPCVPRRQTPGCGIKTPVCRGSPPCPNLWFCFLWTQLPVINHGLKLLTRKFQKGAIREF